MCDRELEAILRELEAQHTAQTVLLTTCKEKEHALESHLSSTTRSLELQIGENQCGEKKITELQGKMRQVVQENKQLREENERFQKGLVDAQRRADENGVSSRKADDNLRGLREELDSSQADLQSTVMCCKICCYLSLSLYIYVSLRSCFPRDIFFLCARITVSSTDGIVFIQLFYV